MEELNNQAIVLIYPDGLVEKIPITHLKFHWEYLKDHCKHSKRFLPFCGDAINDINHFSLDKVLVENGICVLYNWNIREIVEDKTFLNKYHAHFLYYLPSSFQSLKQLLEFLTLITAIDFKYVWLRRFDEQKENLSFKNLNEQNFWEFILENKKKLLEEKALLLLYPDGEIEEIPRTKLKFHMEHIKEHFKNSERFKDFMENKIDTYYNHESYKVVKELTFKGIVEVANKVGDLRCSAIKERKNLQEFDFNISLPRNMGSRKQIAILENLFAQFPKQTLHFGKYDFNEVKDITNEEYEMYMEENKFLFSNENLRNQAIILIYPEGEVERILIDRETSYTLYLKRHLKNSRKFYELVQKYNLNFDWGIHFPIDKILLLNGVIILYNYNVKDIVNDSSYVYNYPIFFDVYLSSLFMSKRQKEEFMNLYNEYKDLLVLNIYDRTQERFLEEEEKESFKL